VALIEVSGLTKLYRMGASVVRALDGVDLSIDQGEFVAVTGASGSGKSTLMHLLGCLDRPTGGRYMLGGRAVSDLSDHELASVRNKQIGFVFQTFNLINRTNALENVALPLFYARKGHTKAAAERALERVGLAQRSAHNPNELSGGERQRVAIARAIVNDPSLLLADEPTGNLDSRTGAQIMETFHSLNQQGVTIVLVTHEPDIARQTRRVITMRDGKVVSDRPASELGSESVPAMAEILVARPAASEDAAAGENGKRSQARPPEPVTAQPAGMATAGLTPRRMRGAVPGMVLGLLAMVCWGVVFAVPIILKSLNYDLQNLAQSKRPPAGVMVAGLVTILAVLGAFVLGIMGIVFSSGALKRMRTEPGCWRGRKQAVAGMVLGWLAVAIPVVGVVARIVSKLR
jgi:ABC-type lipoprotein export system ATPase subunit